jgi:hypothetical protein
VSDLQGGVRETHPVVTVTLDWIADNFHPPAVLKLDVEGSELAALQGGMRLLAKHRPAIFVEVHERNSDEVTALLRQHRYDLFDISRGYAQRRPVSRAVYNTLALPNRVA